MFVGYCAFGGGRDECGVFTQYAAFLACPRGFKGRHARSVFGVVDEQVDRILHGVDFDRITALHDPDRATFGSLRTNMTNVKSMTPSGESSVGNKGYFLNQAASRHRTGG